MSETPDLPLTGSRKLEVRLWSHILFEASGEPESDEQVRRLAERFSPSFGNVLQRRTRGGKINALIVEARRAESGWVEILFVITYYGVHAASTAPALFQTYKFAFEEMAKLIWHFTGSSLGHDVVDSESVLAVEGIDLDEPAKPAAEEVKRTATPSGTRQDGHAESPPVVNPPTPIPSDKAGAHKDQGESKKPPRWPGALALVATGLSMLVLVAGGYWMFVRTDPSEARLSAVEAQLDDLERRHAPTMTQTVNIDYPPPVVVRSSEEPPPRQVRRYRSSDAR